MKVIISHDHARWTTSIYMVEETPNRYLTYGEGPVIVSHDRQEGIPIKPLVELPQDVFKALAEAIIAENKKPSRNELLVEGELKATRKFANDLKQITMQLLSKIPTGDIIKVVEENRLLNEKGNSDQLH